MSPRGEPAPTVRTPKIVCIVEARFRATRLPGKVPELYVAKPDFNFVDILHLMDRRPDLVALKHRRRAEGASMSEARFQRPLYRCLSCGHH